MSKNICKTNKADHGKCRKRDLTECKKSGKTKQLWLRKSERPLVKLRNVSEGKRQDIKARICIFFNTDGGKNR